MTFDTFSNIMEESTFAEGERFAMEDNHMFQNDKVGIGVIGVGSRGRGIVKTVLGIDHACVTTPKESVQNIRTSTKKIKTGTSFVISSMIKCTT